MHLIEFDQSPNEHPPSPGDEEAVGFTCATIRIAWLDRGAAGGFGESE
jgi:hypothetical protein